MNNLLKRLSRLFTILFLLTLCGCGANPATDTNPESATASSGSAISSETTADPSATMDPERRKQVQLEINSNSQNKILIPDPATITEDVVKISLQTEAEDDDDIWNYETEDEYIAKCQNRYGADLSFAGLGDNVMVSSYVVGNMTDPDSNVKNCLALFVHENPETEQEKNYFLVLDYGQGSYYLMPTEFFLRSWSSWDKLQVRDMTGDGTQELVIATIHNKWIDVGVYRCDVQNHSLFSLFSTIDDYDEEKGDFPDRAWFQGHLEDDYKVVLEFPEINYSKTVSMIDDGGYSREELQVGSEDPYGGINFVALWKNGKLQKKKVDEVAEEDMVFLYTLDHVDYPSGKSGKPQLELVRGIFIGHRSECIGNMHLFLQYDPDQDRLTLKKVKYVDYKQRSKEWENFDEWDEE
ncbi:MAG: hypothetical protein K2K70_02065 [Lachnospiraceae bacterium]|nr:hypothetical protein [Lachnospiraceae bacterium]